jgi:hypothetical protein
MLMMKDIGSRVGVRERWLTLKTKLMKTELMK